MNKLTLAKQDLPPGYIGAAVGEPYLVKDQLFLHFPHLVDVKIPTTSIFEYTKPQGYDPLVKLLEEKHQAPVIIGNGAKQCLGALFYALSKNKVKSIYLDKPYWSLFPPLIKMHGLRQENHPYSYKSAYLFVSPNNPDGNLNNIETFINETNNLQHNRRFIIHDAAYYNHIYLPRTYQLLPQGDVQVFTCSKLLGLSQLRLGYSVFHDTALYNDVLNYMEHMTVGASILSQLYAFDCFNYIKNNLESFDKYQDDCFKQLQQNRQIANQINPSILEIDTNQQGMFLWAKCGNPDVFSKCQIMVADGIGFGAPGFIRMNLALPTEKIKEIVDRLNNL